MLCYGLDRLSEDIDLDGINKTKLAKVVDSFCKERGYGYRIGKDTDTTKRYLISYKDEIRPLKVEVSYRRKAIDERDYHNINGIMVYKLNEICRMKAMAYNSRDKIRDLYDIAFMCNKH